MGGKSKKVTVGFKFYAGIHLALSRRRADALRTMRAGGRVAWSGYQAESGQIYVNKPKLFGGDKREGGVQGYMDVLMGEPTQGANDYLASKISGLMPAFRGFMSMVWRGGLISMINPYMKPWKFEGTWIKEGWGSGECWYPEKAEIERPSGVIEPPAPYEVFGEHDSFEYQIVSNTLPPNLSSPSIPGSGYSTADGGFGHEGDASPPLPYTEWPIQAGIWIRKVFSVERSGTITIAGFAENSAHVYVDGVYVGSQNPTNVDGGHGSFSFEVELSSGDHTIHVLGLDETADLGSPDNTRLEFSGTFQEDPVLDLPDMNPAHIVYQIATDPELEMGYPTADIDEESFTAAADTFFEEGLGLTLTWNGQMKIRDFLKIVLDHCGANFYADPFTGKFVLKAIRFDYDPDTLDVYDEDDIVAVEDFQRPGYGEAVNQVIVRYRDRINHVEAATPPWQDLASIQAQGRVIGETIDYPGFSHGAIANRVVARDGKILSARLAKAKLRIKRSLWRGAPSGVIKVSWAKLGLSGVIFRIIDINSGTLESGEIAVTVAEDVFGLPESTYTAEQPSGWVPPVTDPVPVTMQEVLEAPYWDISRNLSPADLDYFDDDGAFALTLAATANPIETGYTIHTRIDPAEYEEVGEGGFVAYAVTSGAVTRSQTVVPYTSGLELEDVVVGQRAMLGSGRSAEWAEVTAIDTEAETVTLSRGILDTTPQEHALGTRIWFATEDDVGLDPTERATAEELDVKLTASSGSGETEVEDATPMSITFDQRFFRPYPPGKVRINGEAFPESIEEALSVTWAHRDRVQQTAGYISQDENSIGPEAGTTYTGRLYDDETDGLLLEETSISTTTWEPVLVGAYRLRVELTAVRDEVESWQPQVRVFDFGFSSRLTEYSDSRVTEGGAARIPETGDSLAGGGEEPGTISEGAMIPALWDGTQFISYRVATDTTTGGQTVHTWTSSDGTTWTKRTPSIGFVPNGIAFGNGVYVAVKGPWFGYTSDLDSPWTSFTITTWPERNVGGGIAFSRPIFDGTRFISSGGHGLVIVSTDGETWTEVGTESLDPDFGVGGITFDGVGTYVSNVGHDGERKMFSSADLETWVEGSYTPDSNNPDGYTGKTKFTNGKFFLVGWKSDGFASIPMLLSSDDGDAWTECSFTTSGGFSKLANDIEYFNSLYVVAGRNCNAYSTDLSTWTVENINADPRGRTNILNSGDELIAFESRGTSSITTVIMRTTDGVSWSDVSL